MDIYKQICAKLVEAWDNTADGEYEDFGRAASYLVDWTRAELATEEPVVGELVVVAHWGDFDYPMDAVQLGRLRETQQHDGKTYYYVDDLRRGFRHCRTLTPRVLPVKEAASLEQGVQQMQPFVVRHYTEDERPTIKGNGFDGLEIGEDREEAEAFVAWINEKLARLGQ